ncbi:hypothetical protein COCC4DRAFT_51527 [Bipolaris maydis ATCC 48331]|uniref:HNH domain-containing protein n=2 Tax=Cochliobolus heterostrophus TaxID=5016 RepID=M2TH68_COCH5|nr:uncharacterized protein COCC4DRAFT_51527 [Bipolaris maydis ATCC 48331]EMD96785.1 hypothetical protein COCHEDRAFT_1123417 [Bipolaris maydis C5]KAH7558249.1 hypothetical protein BM1_05521 [Bipolaris maydis]ENI03652.1 hypothetical protein COCC4DRAFT_51527 [Bipolaris maydis ATCC 48331]KAJ5031331.1 hypothetical protein J3E73DRAFT_202638 [Bipolaris maydis]KAJ5060618.1 hypothetical protein J3E74DRAFT_465803 [Bipolaris maydis]
MAEPIPAEEQSNYETFRDCMSEVVLKALAAPTEKPKPKKKRHAKKGSKSGKSDVARQDKAVENSTQDSHTNDAEDLGEFIEYLSALVFPSLPASLRTLTHALFTSTPWLEETYSPPLSAATCTDLLTRMPPVAIDSLESYALLPPASDQTDHHNLLTPLFTAYINAVTAPPPVWSSTRTEACQLCGRDWVPLTYHHLIPKSAHARVLKRAWHAEEMLNSVAWLCRACHSFVHGLVGNEELARSFYTVELIVQGGVQGDSEVKERVERWVKWVGGVRWKSR